MGVFSLSENMQGEHTACMFASSCLALPFYAGKSDLSNRLSILFCSPLQTCDYGRCLLSLLSFAV